MVWSCSLATDKSVFCLSAMEGGNQDNAENPERWQNLAFPSGSERIRA